MKQTLLIALLLAGITPLCAPSISQAASTSTAYLGMDAPPLQVRDWVQGGPLSPGGKGNTNIYVVEFWATWCGPCKRSIPHLSELQTRFRSRGVLFVGVSDEAQDKVAPFVKEMGARMNYAVALDDNGKTTAAYMTAFGETGIPHAFVVGRDQKVLWSGHPLAGLDGVLDEILSGRFDLTKSKVASQFLKEAQRYLTLVTTAGASPESDRLGRKIVSDVKDQPPLLMQFAQVILFDNRVKAKDLKLALEAAQQAIVATGRTDAGALQIYAHALAQNGQRAEAIAVLKEALPQVKQPADREKLEADMAEFQKGSIGSK